MSPQIVGLVAELNEGATSSLNGRAISNPHVARKKHVQVKPLTEQERRALKVQHKAQIKEMSRAEVEARAKEPTNDVFHDRVRAHLKKARRKEKRHEQLIRRQEAQRLHKLRAEIAFKTLGDLRILLSVDDASRQIAGNELLKRLRRMPLLELVRLPDRPELEWIDSLVTPLLRTDERSIVFRLNKLNAGQLKQLLSERRCPPKEWIQHALELKKRMPVMNGPTKTNVMPYSSDQQVDWWREQT